MDHWNIIDIENVVITLRLSDYRCL